MWAHLNDLEIREYFFFLTIFLVHILIKYNKYLKADIT